MSDLALQAPVVYPEPADFPGGLRIYFTTDDGERHQAYAIRYQVFTVEGNRHSFADHGRKVFKDAMDDGAHHLLVVRHGQVVVATLRVVFRRDGAFLIDDMYLLPELHSLLGRNTAYRLDEIAVADRALILPDFRKRGLYEQMWQMAFKMCRLNGVEVLLGRLIAERMVDFHERQGWINYRPNVPWMHDGAPVIHFVAKMF